MSASSKDKPPIFKGGTSTLDRSRLCGDSSVMWVSPLVLFPAVTVLVELLLLSVRRKLYAEGILLLLGPRLEWIPSMVRFLKELLLPLLPILFASDMTHVLLEDVGAW